MPVGGQHGARTVCYSCVIEAVGGQEVVLSIEFLVMPGFPVSLKIQAVMRRN